MSPEASVLAWALHNGCGGEAVDSLLHGEHTVSTYSGCENGTEVIHIRTEGAGHSVPDDIEGGAVEVAWDFFERQL